MSRRLGGVRTPRAHRWLERATAVIAWTAVLAIALVLAFVARQAAPMFLGGAHANLRDLVLPRQWAGYHAPTSVWQPIGFPPKSNLVPLVVGTAKITILSMMLSVPLGLGCAVYTSQVASRRVREWVKPMLEVLAGVPSVVLGFFAQLALASLVQALFGVPYRLNAMVAALGLSMAVVPLVFTIADDALEAVPANLLEGSAALGAARWQTTLFVVMPAALPGLVAAIVLGFGRAIGETMIVLMASGNAAVMRPLDPTTSARTLTATIAAELGETAQGSLHWQVLFALGLLLFFVTGALDFVGHRAIGALRRRLHASVEDEA